MSSFSNTNIDSAISFGLKVCFSLTKMSPNRGVPNDYAIVIIFNFFSINFLRQTRGTSNK